MRRDVSYQHGYGKEYVGTNIMIFNDFPSDMVAFVKNWQARKLIKSMVHNAIRTGQSKLVIRSRW